MADEVLVFQYSYWDQGANDHLRSVDFATLETIKAGLGMPIHESAIWVNRVHVIDGFYIQPRTTV